MHKTDGVGRPFLLPVRMGQLGALLTVAACGGSGSSGSANPDSDAALAPDVDVIDATNPDSDATLAADVDLIDAASADAGAPTGCERNAGGAHCSGPYCFTVACGTSPDGGP